LIGPLSTHQHRSLDMLPSPKIEAQICFPWPLLYSYIHGSCTVSKQYGIKLRYYWKRIGERSRNLGTPWELDGNTLPPPTLPPQTQKKKNQATLSASWAFSLAAWNFYFQKCFSPSLTWANTPLETWGIYSLSYSDLLVFVEGLLDSEHNSLKNTETYSLTSKKSGPNCRRT
jgi:hypothetical protein